MNIIFKVQGGLGKHIASTAFIKKIKQKYPQSNLIVLSAWKDVFLNNPHVNESSPELSTFYDKFVEGNDVLFLTQDPYDFDNHMNRREHLIATWFSMIGEEYKGEMPEIYFSPQEEQYYTQFYKTPKPLFMIQPNGGAVNTKLDKYNWARDIPPNIVQKVIDAHKDDYTVGVIRTEDQIKYNNCVDLVEKWRQVAIGMKYSKKRLLIDSSFQHIAAALGLESTVLWNVTDPKVFGYDLHKNIVANKHTKPQPSTGVMTKYNLAEPLQNMPYESFVDVFNYDEISKAL